MFKNNISKIMPAPALGMLVVAFLLGSTNLVFAQAATLGDIFCNAYNNTKPIGFMFDLAAYVIGLAMLVQGIYHLNRHSEHRQNHPLQHSLMLFLGSALLLSLPAVIGTVVTSIYGTPGTAGTLACAGGATPPSAAGGQGLDVMLSGFVGNIKGPLISLVSLISIVTGLFMIVRGLAKAGKHGFDPKTHSIHNILTHVLFGALLMTIGDNLNMMMNSVFGTSTVTGSSAINWTFLSSLSGGVSTQFQNAVIAGLTFIQIIGVIAFVRGWMVMKKVVEGGGNVTMAQGITHIVGGVLAINIFAFLKVMDTTFGTGML